MSNSKAQAVVTVIIFIGLFGCGGDADEAKKLGFTSVGEMKEVHAKGWHTKKKYEEDTLALARKSASSNVVKKPMDTEVPLAAVSGTKDVAQTESVIKSTEVGVDALLNNDDATAYPLLKMGADNGNKKAATYLGVLYAFSEGSPPADPDKALELIKSSAEAGEVNAQKYMGRLYLSGELGSISTTKSMIGLDWYKKAAAQGDDFSMFEIGLELANGNLEAPDVKQGLEWLHKAADRGNAPAMYVIGNMYSNGKAMPKDMQKAIEWWKKSAQLDNVESQLILAKINYDGIVIPVDLTQSAIWYEKAANLGNAEAQTAIGSRYILGKGVPLDKQKGVGYLRKAAAQGDKTAKETLAAIDKRAAFDACWNRCTDSMAFYTCKQTKGELFCKEYMNACVKSCGVSGPTL